MHPHVGMIDGTESYSTEVGGLYWYDVRTNVNENHQLGQKLFYGEQTLKHMNWQAGYKYCATPSMLLVCLWI